MEKRAVRSAAERREALDKAPPDKVVLLQVQTPQGIDFVVLKAAAQ